METKPSDRMTAQIAEMRLSRRQALRQGSKGLAAAGLAAAGLGRAARAQEVTSGEDATPGAAPATAAVTAGAVAAALPVLEHLAQATVGKGGVPALAIAVVHRDQVVYLKGFGVRQAGATEPVDADTVFQLASMSKPIAATVVAALVGEGTVSWDSRLADLDPDLQLFDPWVTREVTVRDCFCHRTGLPGAAGDDLEEVGFARDEILHRLRYLKPASSFRSQYAYSNFGLTVGAVAAAKAAGLAWEEASAEKLYKPLGMTATSSRFADYQAATNRALLHIRSNGAWAAKVTRDPDPQSPAGGVSSTARDAARWVRLVLGNGVFAGKRLIPVAALPQAQGPQIVKGTNITTDDPAYYGLGWNVDYDEAGRIFWAHAGAFSRGARTIVSLLPAANLGIVVLANAFPTGVPDGLAAAFYDQVLIGKHSRDWIAFWNKPYEALYQAFYASSAAYAKPPAQPQPALPPKSYTGTYTNHYFGDIVIGEGPGDLTLQIGPQQTTFPLRHWNRDEFLYEPAPELPGSYYSVTFAVGNDGTGQQVVIDGLNNDGQGTFARVAPAR